VIGGLIRKNTTETVQGIPLLRDIPLFGHLFKSSSNVDESRELLIFVTPTVLDIGDLTDASEIPEAMEQ
jgi:type IV pilus assembly protein PilQ